MFYQARGSSPTTLPGRSSSSGRGGCFYVFVGIGLATLGIVVLAVLGLGAYFVLSPAPPTTVARLQPAVRGPGIAFQEPAPGTRVAVGESLLVSATARDENRVTRVDLWIDNQLAIQQSAPDPNGVTPFSLIHNLVATKAGTYALIVRASNAQGITGESPVLYVTVFDVPAALPGETPALTRFSTPVSGELPTPVQTPAIAQPPTTVQPLAPVQLPSPTSPFRAIPSATKPPIGVLPIAPPQVPMGWLPGLIPEMISMPRDLQKVILPGFKPGVNLKDLLNPPNAAIKAPLLQKADAKDCNVTLTWEDNSDNESDFVIYRRVKPGQISHRGDIGKVGANQTKHVDQVPGANTYVYAVQAVRIDNFAIVQQSALSNYVEVIVPPSVACIQDPKAFKQIVFMPVKFVPDNADLTNGALKVEVANSPTWRFPPFQGQYDQVGDWSDWDWKRVIPAPASAYLPDDTIHLRAEGEARTVVIGKAKDELGKERDMGAIRESPIADLGWTSASHRVKDLLDPQRGLPRYTTEKSQGVALKKGGFTLTYQLWIEDVQWTGKGTSDGAFLPTPQNLRFPTQDEMTQYKIDKDSRALVWNWSGPEDFLEAFILYGSYSCPGEETLTPAPVVLNTFPQQYYVRKELGGAWWVWLDSYRTPEPDGCAVRYQVSAYGPTGESAVSNALDGQTRAPEINLLVTFDDLTVSDTPQSKPVDSRIRLFANDLRRTSGRLFIDARTYALKDVVLNDRYPNNAMTVGTQKSDYSYDINLRFYVDGLCEGSAGWGTRNPKEQIILQSSDGNCKVTVKVKNLGAKP